MNIRRYFKIVAIITISNNAMGQHKNLKNGDQLPNVAIEYINNGEKTKGQISDFKAKLLILDFWGTWCAPCVAAIPKMDSLQKLFKGQVQFLPITDEPYERVRSFSDHIYNSTKLKLLTVYNDRTIRKMFNYDSLPYYVWLDSTGKIIAQTSLSEINPDNIQKAFHNDLTKIKNRNDNKKLSINLKKPLFNHSFTYRLTKDSMVTKGVDRDWIEGSSFGTKFIQGLPLGRTTNDSTRYTSVNVSVKNLYAHLYLFLYYGRMTLGIASTSRIAFDIKDKNKLLKLENSTRSSEEYKAFLSDNGKCYEVLWPKSIEFSDYRKKFQIVKADLDRYFGIPIGIKTSIEKRKVERCYVIEKIGSTELLKTKETKPSENFDMYSYKIENMDFELFFNRLSGYYFQNSTLPFVDKSGIKGNIDLNLQCKMTNMQELNEQLIKYGLRINIKPAIADVLVFKDL